MTAKTAILSALLLIPASPLLASETLRPLNASPPKNPQTALQDIHDIYPPLPTATPPNWLLIGAVCIAVVIIAALIVVLLRRRKKNQIVPFIPAHQTALAELALARRLIVGKNSLAYAERASRILRHYIEQRFSIHSTRKTTRELMASLQQNEATKVLASHQDTLTACLDQCDMAKYAHKTSGTEALEALETAIRQFIEKTIPPPQEGP